MQSNSQWRLSKFLSLFAGLSRREAEREIMSGNVMLNNAIPKNAAVMVEKSDIITYKKRRILPSKQKLEEASSTQVIAIYKPVGFVVTRSDEKLRKTVYNLLPKDMQSFHYIGRLDINSEGLLFFTNNPQFARSVENPKNQIPRVYHVKAHGLIDEKKLSRMQKGVIIEGISHRPDKISILPRTREESSNTWLEVTLTSGKNREIRKLLQHFNLQVAKLVRVSFGGFSIKDFPKESIHKLTVRQQSKLEDLLSTVKKPSHTKP